MYNKLVKTPSEQLLTLKNTTILLSVMSGFRCFDGHGMQQKVNAVTFRYLLVNDTTPCFVIGDSSGNQWNGRVKQERIDQGRYWRACLPVPHHLVD